MDTTHGLQVPPWTMADRLRKARESAGLEQRELAADLGISRNTVNNYERGKTTRHSRPVVLAWALRCGVPEAWLWTGEVPAGDAPPSVPWLTLGGAAL